MVPLADPIAVMRHMPTAGWVVLAVIWSRAWWGMRVHWISRWNLMLFPVLLICGGVAGLYPRVQSDGWYWGFCALLALPAGFFTAPRPIAVERHSGRVQLPASIVAPLRYFVIFFVRMELLISVQMYPEYSEELLLATSIFSGCVVGYYVGWCWGLLAR